MGDTTKISVTETWTAIFSLTLGQSYNIQNAVNKEMYLFQGSTTPDADEIGFVLASEKSAILIKETNDIFIRTRAGNGTAHINQID